MIDRDDIYGRLLGRQLQSQLLLQGIIEAWSGRGGGFCRAGVGVVVLGWQLGRMSAKLRIVRCKSALIVEAARDSGFIDDRPVEHENLQEAGEVRNGCVDHVEGDAAGALAGCRFPADCR